MAAKSNTKEFISRAQSLHGDRYDYTNVNYINTYTPVNIICGKHGLFKQKPLVHLRGSGCPYCIFENHALSKEEFLNKAREVHRDEYDYSHVDYKNAKTSVTIICKTHGAFKQLAGNHIQGMGCLQCGRDKAKDKRTSTINVFIEKAKKVHGNKYDYSQINYKKGKLPLKIICKKHGPFEQTGTDHLSGHGCHKCAKITRGEKKRSTRDEFIEKSKKIHGEKYCYSQVTYQLNNKSVVIKCKKHGEFKQIPSNHLRGAGCPKCAAKERGESQRWTTESFINEAVKIHGDRYDYSNAIYTTAKVPIIIICKEHGTFKQTPDSHLNETGCPKCGLIKRAKTQSMPFEKFLKKVLEVHNDKYSYDITKKTYSNLATKAKFTCPIHGDFEQIPEHHLRGSGCQNCNESRGEKKIAFWLQKNGIEFERQKTFNELKGRNNRLLSFDFYLPEYHVLIEFDGIQHFEPVKAWGRTKHETTQKYDRLKDAWARDNGYSLQRIRYDEEEKIDETLRCFIPTS